MSTYSVLIFFQLSQKIYEVTQHTQKRLLLKQHFYLQRSHSQSESDKKIHSFNCFIEPTLPWIIYVAPTTMFPLSPIFYAQLLKWLALYHSNNLPLHLSTFSVVYLSPCYPSHLLDTFSSTQYTTRTFFTKCFLLYFNAAQAPFCLTKSALSLVPQTPTT